MKVYLHIYEIMFVHDDLLERFSQIWLQAKDGSI
jgi:hypothetical protein